MSWETVLALLSHMKANAIAWLALISVALISALAFGFIPNISGFARASEVASVVQAIHENRAEYLGGELFNLKIKQCASKSPGEKEALQRQIVDLQLKYNKITGQTFPLPACSEL